MKAKLRLREAEANVHAQSAHGIGKESRMRVRQTKRLLTPTVAK